MSIEINTPEGCKRGEKQAFLHPSGAPFIDIYQAGAQRTIGAVAPEGLIHCCQGSRATAAPLHRLHPSNMSPIAPVDLAGGDDTYCKPPGPHGTRALHPGDTTTRVTDGTSDNSARVTALHGAHPLRALHPLRQLHPSDCLLHGHDVGTRIPIGERPEPHRQETPASAAAFARCRVNKASRSTARRCSAAATLSARTGS